jgi:hypothetical protein
LALGLLRFRFAEFDFLGFPNSSSFSSSITSFMYSVRVVFLLRAVREGPASAFSGNIA